MHASTSHTAHALWSCSGLDQLVDQLQQALLHAAEVPEGINDGAAQQDMFDDDLDALPSRYATCMVCHAAWDCTSSR